MVGMVSQGGQALLASLGDLLPSPAGLREQTSTVHPGGLDLDALVPLASLFPPPPPNQLSLPAFPPQRSCTSWLAVTDSLRHALQASNLHPGTNHMTGTPPRMMQPSTFPSSPGTSGKRHA